MAVGCRHHEQALGRWDAHPVIRRATMLEYGPGHLILSPVMPLIYLVLRAYLYYAVRLCWY